MKQLRAWFGIVVLALSMVFVVPAEQASAAATLVNTAFIQSNNSSTLSASYPTAAVAGNLLIVVCAADLSVTFTTPTGFSVAISQSGTPSQVIYYKIAAGGETAIDCTFSTSTFVGMHIYQYSGIDPNSVLLTTGSATGTGTAVGSGSVTTSVADALLFTAVSVLSNTAYSTWSNSFTERADFPTTGGNPNARKTYGAADRSVTATGTYSTTATAGLSGVWRGQIVAFRLGTPVLSVDIVDATGTPVATPSASLTAANSSFNCQTVTGTLGVSAQRIRVTNTTASAAWTVAIAATSGATSLWDSGTDTYDFNDSAGAPAGCADGADTDTDAGQLTINPAAGTVAPESGCTTTGVSLGASTAFAEGSADSVTLLSASGSANTNCYWDVTGIGLSQTIPPQQTAGSYSLDLTLTITAS